MQGLNQGLVNTSYNSSFIYSDNTPSRKQDGAESFNDKGVNLAKNGEYDNAIICFNRAIELNPDYTEVYANREAASGDKEEFV